MKKRHEYNNKDLLVPIDFRWSRSFISTVTLWCSTQPNVWNIPDEELAVAFQLIFDTVYPDIKYRVTITGSVFSVALQHLSEWRNGFGSAALAMMINFISNLGSSDTRSIAEYLRLDYRFLRDDFESMEAEGMYRSPFLLELVAATHLSNITACIEVPGWNTGAMAMGQDGEGVIALAAAALERAISLIAEGHLEVEPETPSGTDGKSKVKLPKVINKQTGRGTTAPFQFSSANLSGDTAAYRGSVHRRGPAFVREVFSEAHALKAIKAEPSPGALAGGETSAVNPRFSL